MGEIDHFVLAEEKRPFAVLAGSVSAPAPNVLQAYISAYTAPGATVLDPFAQTDGVAREALKLARKAILSDFNPLAAFTARTLHSTLSEQQMTYALVRIAEGVKLQTSLRNHLNDLYLSTCAQCRQPVVVSHFLWSRDEKKPVTKFHRCPCRRSQDGTTTIVSEPVDDQDVEAATRVEARGFHYWYVLDRLAPPTGTRLSQAKQVLEMYTPRNLFALVTTLMQIESAFENPEQQEFLKLILLDCFDRCAKVNASQKNSGGESGRLRAPALFIERNVWQTFETVGKSLSEEILERRREGYVARMATHVEQLMWRGPCQPLGQAPNLYVTQQMARFLTNELPEGSIDLVITEPPRTKRMEYLALSYLWTGWLLGSQQTQVFEHVHSARPQTDWAAYYKASVSSLRVLSRVIREDGAIVFRYESRDLDQYITLLLSGVAAGLRLRRVLYSPGQNGANHQRTTIQEDEYVMEFVRASNASPANRQSTAATPAGPRANRPELSRVRNRQDLRHALVVGAMHAARALLTRRGEPTHYRLLTVAVYEHLAIEGLLADALALFKEDEDPFTAVRQLVDESIGHAFRDHLVQIVPDRNQGSNAVWWLPRQPIGAIPLSEQIETSIYNILGTSKDTTADSIAQAIFRLFPGLLVPNRGWIQECIASYATGAARENLGLRAEDLLRARTQEHTQLVALLALLGHEFGFKVWIGRNQQKAELNGATLGSLLNDVERNFGPETLLGGAGAAQIDVVWYDLGKHIHAFEVEWTTVFSEKVLARLQSNQTIRRFLVLPEERVQLVKAKLERYPLLARAIEEDPWEFIKFHHLVNFARNEKDRNVFSLNKIVGLTPPIEQETAQLRLL